MTDGIPGSVELNEDELEFFSDGWKVVSGEDKDMVFLSVWVSEEDEAKQEEYLSQHMKYRSKVN